MPTRSRPAEPELPIPDDWISHRPDPAKATEWWAEWKKLTPVERARPAAEVLADVRGERPYDFDE